LALSPGTPLGPYEIVCPLGAGGMGEVYRAKDTKLNRDVAIKVLPESFALDADRVARFTREAQVLASLNHPNIAAIYGIEEQGSTRALVMELVEGEDLSAQIARGPIAPSDALPIAKQIADALETAHEQGIVHRDLKPQNIKVRADGTVKVLDFGLAKAMDPASASSDMAMNSPTMTARATQMGMIIGTAAYMSPEQAKGKAVDKRADIWAFGVVLYEMLTGRRAFEGDDISTTLAAVLLREPEWVALPAETPAGLVTLIRRCLERDPKARLRDIGEARLLLSNPQTMSGSPVTVAASPVATPARNRVAAVSAALILAAAAAAAAWWLKPAPPVTDDVTRFVFALPEKQYFTRTGRHVMAISPDGSRVAYVANEQLYLREIGQLDAQPIRGTHEDPLDPVFSPDGQSIAYFTLGGLGGASLKRIGIAGGTPVVLSAVESSPYGISWRNGVIAFGQINGIQVVADSGGTPRTVVSADPAMRAVQPQLLDDGRNILYTLIDASASGDEGQVVIQSLDGTSRTEIVKSGANAKVLPTGHLIYIHESTLFAMPFDAKRRAVTGTAVPVVEGVSETTASWAGQFSVSDDGTLVYWPGRFSGRARTLLWTNRQGLEEATGVPFRDHAMPRLSPDGKRIALTSSDGEKDIWVLDVGKDTPTRLTFGPAADSFAIWMPDSRRVIFSSTDGGQTDIYRRMADGTGNLGRLTEGGAGGAAESVSPDGRFLVYRKGNPSTNRADLHLLPLDGSGPSRPLLADPNYNEYLGVVSPDGRWIAYQSNESSKNAIYVRPFPNVDGGKWMVSAEGGTQPRWSRSGRELFYVTYPRLFSVPVVPGSAFAYEKPQAVFESLQISLGPYSFGTTTGYDVGLDGRFLFMKAEGVGTTSNASLVIVSRWFDELRAKVPVTR
jgi:Tol biopolymer transport system component